MILKKQHEMALNSDNLAYQEVREAWDVGVFRNAKNGSKQVPKHYIMHKQMHKFVLKHINQ